MTAYEPCVCLFLFASLCYLLPLLSLLSLFHFYFPTHIPFLLFLPSSLTFPFSCHPLRLPFTALLCSPPFSFSILAPSLSLPFSLLPSHPTERYLSLSFSSFHLFFFPSFHFYPFLIPLPLPSLSYFPISLSPIVVLCSIHSTVIYNST